MLIKQIIAITGDQQSFWFELCAICGEIFDFKPTKGCNDWFEIKDFTNDFTIFTIKDCTRCTTTYWFEIFDLFYQLRWLPPQISNQKLCLCMNVVDAKPPSTFVHHVHLTLTMLMYIRWWWWSTTLIKQIFDFKERMYINVVYVRCRITNHHERCIQLLSPLTGGHKVI